MGKKRRTDLDRLKRRLYERELREKQKAATAAESTRSLRHERCATRKCRHCGQDCIEWPCRLCAARNAKQLDPHDLLFDVDEFAEFGLRGEDAMRKMELPPKMP